MRNQKYQLSVTIPSRASSIHSLTSCVQRGKQIQCPESILAVTKVNMNGLYKESSNSPVSVSSNSSEMDDDVILSCTHSEISDVNEQEDDDIFGLLYREENAQESNPMDQTTGKIRTPSESNDDSNQSNDEIEEEGIFPEFWLGFNAS